MSCLHYLCLFTHIGVQHVLRCVYICVCLRLVIYITNMASFSELSYNIKEFVGPWWKGACFRQRRTKTVLNNINVQFCSGELTAILGSSG
jgi:ABC-type polysaccharide/polyol phosphate transport system ATPase subunit